MKRAVAYISLICCAVFLLSGFQEVITARRRAPSGTPTTVTFATGDYGSADQNAANVTATWNTAPTAGKGAMVLFWHSNATTVTSVCNGTGTDGCTGSDTFTSAGTYANGTNFKSEIYYNCNLAHTGSIIITPSASSQIYAMSMWFSGQTTTGTNCNDASGPKNNQGASGTAESTGAITTTNAHDLVVGGFSNNCGGSYTAGTDGQGNTMTFVDSVGGGAVAGVVSLTYFNESATNTYTPTATGPTCSSGWNGQAMAFK